MSKLSSPDLVKAVYQGFIEKYEQQRQKLKEIISELYGRISISVDSPLYGRSWSDHKYHYCITAQFIDNDWNLKKVDIKYCAGEFYPVDAVLEALRDLNIEGKVLSLTGDSDTADLVKEDIQGRRELVLKGQLFDVQCNCDMVSRMVQSAFKMIDEIVDKFQLLSGLEPSPLWYCTTSKLKKVLELEALGKFSPGNVSDSFEVPSEEEWNKVRTVCRVTDRIYEITKPLYHARMQTANIYLPHLLEIHSYLAHESDSSDKFAKALAEKMLETYTAYWNDMYLMLGIAAFMDPRYKMRLIEFFSSKLHSEEKAATVLETIRKLYDSYVVQSNEKQYVLSKSKYYDDLYEDMTESDNEEDEEDEEITETWKEKQADNLIEKLKILKEFNSAHSVNDQPPNSDLEMYLEEPAVPWTETFSVLHWWKNHCGKYPRLCMMARDFLAVPMSVATSSEAYYTEPRLPRSTSSDLEFANAIVCGNWTLGHDN